MGERGGVVATLPYYNILSTNECVVSHGTFPIISLGSEYAAGALENYTSKIIIYKVSPCCVWVVYLMR